MRYIQTLNGIWDFAFTGGVCPEPPFEAARPMAVPGCFDLVEPFCGKRGYAVYTRKVRASGPSLLEIDGAGIAGNVFWDEKKIGSIEYAYMPEKFVFDAGNGGEHTLSVVLDNFHSEQFRANFDFFAYGGIYGDVTITSIPADFISKVRISTEDRKTGKIRIRAEYSRKGTLPARLKFDTGFQLDTQFADGQLDCTLELPGFRLWELDSPMLHTLTLKAGEDEVTETFGIREFTAAGRKLLLNGKEIKLFGVNRHESHPTTGAAVPPQIMNSDVAMLKDAGFNFIRGSHYPQRKALLELCDRMGILVWEETLGWGVKAPTLAKKEYVKSQLEQAEKMTYHSFNHPCVVMRGFLNETDSQFPETRPVIKALYDRIRSIDKHILITFASNKYEEDVCTDLVDVVSMNPYPGWYDSRPDSINTVDQVFPRLSALSKAVPKDKPFLISEIGAEALLGFRDPLKTYWTEEYQAELLLKVFEYVSQTDCAGVSIWQYADTRSYVSGSGIFARARGFNNKGILDEYRRPKLAWHELQNFLCSRQRCLPLERKSSAASIAVNRKGKSMKNISP